MKIWNFGVNAFATASFLSTQYTLGRSRFEISRVFYTLRKRDSTHSCPLLDAGIEELYHTDVELYFDFKVLADIYSINELPQDHLLTLDAASRIQVGPGHDLVILLLNGNGRVFQISAFPWSCSSSCASAVSLLRVSSIISPRMSAPNYQPLMVLMISFL